MDTEHVVSWFVGVTAALTIAQDVRDAGLTNVWRLVPNALAVAVLILGFALSVPGAAYVALGIWLGFTLTPMLAFRRAQRFAAAERFTQAARVAKVGGWLAPWGSLREQARFFDAEARAQRGDFDGARKVFSTLRDSRWMGELAVVELLRLETNWHGIVAHIDGQPVGTRDIRLLPIYLRALGETGDVERLLVYFANLPKALRRSPAFQLLGAAFAGRPDWVDRLAAGPLAKAPERSLAYFKGVASQSAGDLTTADVHLSPLAEDPGLVGRQARLRRQRPLPPAIDAVQSDAAKRALEMLGTQVTSEPTVSSMEHLPKVTYALMVVLTLVFIAEAPGGATDKENLVSMGALVLPPDGAYSTLWWRVLCAGFLHYGTTHLLMNLLGLWILGSILERIWSGPRVLFLFLVANLGAFAVAPYVATASRGAPQVMVGASGGVMGLVGALTAFTAIGFFYGKNKLLLRQLQMIGIVLVVQVAFDLSTPMVASSLHIAGFFWGSVAALPFAVLHWRRRRTATSLG